jgi:hypothetical protein
MNIKGSVEKEKLSRNIPGEIRKLPNWVGYIKRENKNRIDKIPMNVLAGRPAKSNDPKTWTDFETAVDLSIQRNYAGIGFMFTPPYVGIDIDKCIKDGSIDAQAKKILSEINSYSEYSPSRTGIHIICKGTIPRSRKLTKLGIEVYSNNRFFTITGDKLPAFPDYINQSADKLSNILSDFEKNNKSRDLLERIRKSNDGKFIELFDGNWQEDYPSQSEADLALCNKLAFWTGKDPEAMDMLFRKSGLMRPKWDEKHFADSSTYGQSIIRKAIEGCTETYQAETAHRKNITQGEVLTRYCEQEVKDYYRDQQGNSFIVLPIDRHLEVCQTNSTRFRNWLAKCYRQKYKSPPCNEALKQARIQVEAKCEDSFQFELYNRVGWYKDNIYYDLTTLDWKGVSIGKEGWQVVYLPPVFRRYSHQGAQVMPVKGCSPKRFLEFCNINTDDYCLFMTVLASFFIPDIPHVIPVQIGEQGTGKSNNSRLIKSLCDPSKVMLISSPKDLEQAQMIADKHWINTFDNLSRISEWFSDFLCRAVTGEGDMKRSLYTNDDVFIRTYRRCFVLNGIGNSVCRPDLLDRSIIFDIPPLKETRPEKQISDEWKTSLPGILGGFFTAISKAMAIVGKVTGHEKFRMSDFAMWGAALAEALGYSQDEFFRKYRESVEHKWEDTAEESPIVQKLAYLVESNGGQWCGSATTLLEYIKPETGFDKRIPDNPKALSSELMRIAPVMRSIGIDIMRSKRREPGTGRKLFILRKNKGNTVFGDGVNKGVNICEYHEERPF